ncbi:uncharacterized protein J3D65DRAFT_600441 [Phyllosticta citribraziliensis]|uniref:CCHC-type domain-containing protein n=1 Tax=Phyllosticta citribraziliensis TaxID=989973 RepID=A0ABR1M559_9PEZI
MTLKEGGGSASAWTIMSDLQKRYTRLNHAETQYIVHQRWHTIKWDGDYIGFFISKWSAALTDCLDAGIEISEDTKFFTLMSAIDVQEKKVFKNWVRLTLAETQIKGYKTLGVYFRELIDTCTFESEIRMAQVEGDPKMITKRRCGVCGVTGHVSRGCWHLLPEIAPKELKFEPDKRLVQEFFKRKAEADKRNDKTKGKELGEEGDIEEIINENSGEWEMVMGGMVWYKDYPKIAREETEWWQGVQGSND